MDLIVYGIYALIIGAVVLALYERRKGIRLIEGDAPQVSRGRGSLGFVDAEQTRTADSITQAPNGS